MSGGPLAGLGLGLATYNTLTLPTCHKLWGRLPLSGKVFLACAGLGLAVALASGAVIYEGARSALHGELRSGLSNIANLVALQVDAEAHHHIRTRVDESTEHCRKIRQTLSRVCVALRGVRNAYTVRKVGPSGKWEFVVDCEKDSRLVSHVGDLYDSSERPQLEAALHGPTADTEPAEDQWGAWLSGYAPVRDRAGRVEAVVGVDLSAAQLTREEKQLRAAVVRSVVVALIAVLLLSMVISTLTLRALGVFARAAERIRSGDLDFEVPVTRSDEIGRFTHEFNRMISGLKASRDRLVESARRDDLTGLYNHVHFHERLDREIEKSILTGQSFCLLLLDLDRFADLNARLGSKVGDAVLAEMGAELQKVARAGDILARYESDTFAAILPDTPAIGGFLLAELIRDSIDGHSFSPTADKAGEQTEENPAIEPIRLTLTVGLSCYPEDSASKDGLMMAADIALSRGKNLQRNNVTTYDATLVRGNGIDPRDLYQMLHDPNVAAFTALAAAVDAKDHYTCGHSERVSAYAAQLAVELGADGEFVEAVRMAGLLHDLGKIGIPDAILTKQAALTDDERRAMEQHPAIAGGILQRAPQLDLILPAVSHHHEHWNGKGYPDGLEGHSIPMVARIMAVADSYDAMTSDRPYRKALSHDEAMERLQEGAGRQFDPDMVEAFVASFESEDHKAA